MKDHEKLQQIFESISLDAGYDNYDSDTEEIIHRKKKSAASIERFIKGTIAYYKNLLQNVEKSPDDMGALKELENLQNYLQKHLSQFSQWI